MSCKFFINSQVFEFNGSNCDLIITPILLLSILALKGSTNIIKIRLISMKIIVDSLLSNYCSFINNERLLIILK